MSRSTALILLGVLIILAPLSGLPSAWITSVLVILGAIVALMGIALRLESVKRAQQAAPPPPAPAPESESVIPDTHGPSSIA